jgi:hypothetical protein
LFWSSPSCSSPSSSSSSSSSSSILIRFKSGPSSFFLKLNEIRPQRQNTVKVQILYQTFEIRNHSLSVQNVFRKWYDYSYSITGPVFECFQQPRSLNKNVMIKQSMLVWTIWKSRFLSFFWMANWSDIQQPFKNRFRFIIDHLNTGLDEYGSSPVFRCSLVVYGSTGRGWSWEAPPLIFPTIWT